MELAGRDFQNDHNWIENLQFGCIVAVVDLVDCSKMAPWADGLTNVKVSFDITDLEKLVGDWQPGRYAWKLENIRPIAEPIPYRGKQGLTVIQDKAVLQAIEVQLAQTAEIEQQLQSIREAIPAAGIGGVA